MRTGDPRAGGAEGADAPRKSPPHRLLLTLLYVALLVGIASWIALILPTKEEPRPTTILSQLEVRGVHEQRSPDGSVVVTGSVRNIGNTALEHLQVHVEEVDRDGNVADSANGAMDKKLLRPGIVEEFRVTFEDARGFDHWDHAKLTFTSDDRVIKFRRYRSE